MFTFAITCKDNLTPEEIKTVEQFASCVRQQGPYDTSHWHKVPPSTIVEAASEKPVGIVKKLVLLLLREINRQEFYFGLRG